MLEEENFTYGLECSEPLHRISRNCVYAKSSLCDQQNLWSIFYRVLQSVFLHWNIERSLLELLLLRFCKVLFQVQARPILATEAPSSPRPCSKTAKHVSFSQIICKHSSLYPLRRSKGDLKWNKSCRSLYLILWNMLFHLILVSCSVSDWIESFTVLLLWKQAVWKSWIVSEQLIWWLCD